ncbi:MAG: class I SAM-dependent methyltransferase [Bacteroidia bacterium]|jgi:2-polyprenyl-3-methyl-5-hydroxy-6-metoxy-1,4-benzoquinol methylase|nr:class I SAM-dependent methyltransferase [Bacteroidia bacterium]
MNRYKSKQLVAFLKRITPKTIGGLNRIKIIYRPYICPLNDILLYIPPNAALFDIGCGNGSFLALTAHFNKVHKLGGIEIAQQLVDNANKLLQEVAPFASSDIKKFDGKIVPALKGYSHVTLTDVYHHVPALQQVDFLQQLFTQMDSGTVFILKDIDASKKPWIWFNKLHDLAAAGEIGNEISLQKMSTYLQKIGFVIEYSDYTRMLWYPHYLIVCKRP